MLGRNFRHRSGQRRGFRPVRWAGSSVLAVLAGMSVLGAGTAAATLAQAHRVAGRTPLAQCQSLCVSVQSAGTVAPGQAASFGIRISPSSVLDQVTVRISIVSSRSPSFPAAGFTSCGSGAGTQTCTVGLLQAGQATSLAASARVPGSARGGETATLSATVTWDLLGLIGAGSATGSATVDVAGTPPSPTPTPHPSTTPPGGGHPSPTPSSSSHPGSPSPGGSPPGGSSPGGSSPGGSSPGGGHRGSPSPGLPGGSDPGGAGPGGFGLGLGPEPLGLALGVLPPVPGTGVDGNDSGLFPLINPLPTEAEPGRPRPAAAGHSPYRASAAAEILPLNMRQLGIQAAGLIVLALGIAIAVVRIPLRRRRAR